MNARGHAAATLYEAAAGEWKDAHPTAAATTAPEVAVDPAIRPVWGGAAVAGPAFPVQGAAGDNLALHHAVLAAPHGSVLVADLAGGVFGHWGEVLAVAARQRGIAGLVIDGGVRDVDRMRELGFPVFARHICVRGTRKLFPGALGAGIRLGGVTVSQGDLVVGDGDGVVVLERGRVAAVLDRADRRVIEEDAIMRQLGQGRSTLEVYGLAPR